MKKIKNLQEVYSQCGEEGIIRVKEEFDKYLTESLLKSAKEDLAGLEDIELAFEKKKRHYSFLFKSRYDVLRKLMDAFLLFDKIKTTNHQCGNAHICIYHSELELSWESLETIRLVRNAINYEGKELLRDEWLAYKVQFKILTDLFQREIEKKLCQKP
ncbi:MAG TPA: hypothetical protein VJG90_04700 [Candidatus Nanoarchaeia archaeon]|nr:hypothetical protein [Candidatus Nanoarchaeia archaeon]